jgi:hypothetical protein
VSGFLHCNGRPRLYRIRDEPLLDVTLLDHHVRVVEGAVYVPGLHGIRVALVGAEVLVYQRSTFLQSGLHIHDHV